MAWLRVDLDTLILMTGNKTHGYPPTLGVLLAGGLALRMGGGDKPMRTVSGRPILERVIERLAPQCDELIMSANGNAARFAAFGLPVVEDTVTGFAGPLAGILTALDWAATHRPKIEWIVSVATDCPFLPRDLVTRLQQTRIADNAEIAVAASGGQTHHVIALWNIDLRSAMQTALVTEGIHSVGRWASHYRTVTVEWTTVPLDPFFNANTVEELAEAERIAARNR